MKTTLALFNLQFAFRIYEFHSFLFLIFDLFRKNFLSKRITFNESF